MPPVGFEPTISAGERSQTYALDRAATETGQIAGIEHLHFLREVMQTKLQVLLVIFIKQKFIFEIFHSICAKAENNS